MKKEVYYFVSLSGVSAVECDGEKIKVVNGRFGKYNNLKNKRR